MLEDFLRDIYEKAFTLELLKEVSFYSCIRHPYNSRDLWNEASTYLEKILFDWNKTDNRKCSELLVSAQKAQACFGNLRSFSAVIDNEVIPRIQDYLTQFTGIEVTEGEWTLKSSNTGYLTLRRSDGLYVHSWNDPMWESYLYAYGVYKPGIKKYCVLGGGLGYLAYQLWRLSEEEAEIYVYEIDDEISNYSMCYGVMSLINPEKLHYITDEDKDNVLERFLDEKIGPEIIKTIYYWDEDKYDGEYADDIRCMLSNELTAKVFEAKWKTNYVWNTSSDYKLYSELDPTNFYDEWVVVAAGPSLNENELFIRESVGKRTICAVNSSLKWFSLHGIKPDYCTVCDPSDALVSQIQGYEAFSEDIPLFADFIANSKYVGLYRGPKFFVISDASIGIVDKKYEDKNIWDYGGTVTSMALEAAIKSGAKKIFLVGADLGYPDGITFAEGVGHETGKIDDSEKEVISVDDCIIPTTGIFSEYKYKIENQIEKHGDIEIYNKSLHGAYIKGTYCGKWWEELPESKEFKEYQALFKKINEDSLILSWREKYYIFQQLINRVCSRKISVTDEEEAIIEDAYRQIYDSFVKELNWSAPYNCNTVKSKTYIFTNEYRNKDDDLSRRVLDIAKNEAHEGKNVLIVNSAEKLGGSYVPIKGHVEQYYNHELEANDRLFVNNLSFMYFQLPKGMPEIKHYLMFLESVATNKPERMIITCKYSLLADCCSELLGISTKRIEG